MPLETLRTLSDFLAPRPGLLVTFGYSYGTVQILAIRPSSESSRFIHRTEADLEEGELTRALNEIAEALEEHDERHAVVVGR